MSAFYGRKELLRRIDELHRSNQHVSVVGPRAIGKTVLLEAVVARHAKGSDLFTGAGYVDFRHDPPNSTDAALRRVGQVLKGVFRNAAGGELEYLVKEVNLVGPADELYDQLKIALDMVADGGQRILLVLDGCDPVLQNSSIPRNLWDNLRALGQIKSLRLMTGSRDHLHRLCYNPEARTSDFFRIFYDEPLIVGPLSDGDWKDLFAECGLKLDGSAEKELVNWTGGHPDLVDLLVGRLRDAAGDGYTSKAQVDESAEHLLSRASGRLDALWMDCSDETRGDVVRLTNGELLSAELPADRVRFLVEHGIAVSSGNKIRLVNRFLGRVATIRTTDVSGARKLFERPEDFKANIRTVLELRLAQVKAADAKLLKSVRRAVQHLPEDPDAALGCARDIFDRAVYLIWEVEAPGGKVPIEWIDNWKFSGLTYEVDTYTRDSRLPVDSRGKQCSLLRLATGTQKTRRTTKRISKGTCVLVEHMNQSGDLSNHASGEPTVTMAAAFCLAGIELAEALGRELA